MVIVAQHFSGYGFADLKNAVQERYVKWTTTRAEERLRSEVATVLTEERQRQLLGTESTGEAALEVVVQKMDDYEVQVVLPRIAAAVTSCAAAKEAIATALVSEWQRQLLGAGARKTRDNEPKLPPLPEILALTLNPCEKDAVERCKAAKDPGILIAYWVGANRQAECSAANSPTTPAIRPRPR